MMPFEPMSNTTQNHGDYFLETPNTTFSELSAYSSYFRDCDGTFSVPYHQLPQQTQQCLSGEESWQKFYHSPQRKSETASAISDASRKEILHKSISSASVKDSDELQVEDVDDDEFLEEEYAEAYREQMIPDSPTRLLGFIRKMTLDIQDRLARNKGQEDYCDVYEERFKTTLSGRELYYADLLALASNSEAPSLEKRSHKAKDGLKYKERQSLASHNNHTTNNILRQCIVTCHNSGKSIPCGLPHRGQEMKAVGLGPLEELFPLDPSKENMLNRSRHGTFLEQDIGNSANAGVQNSQLMFVPMALRKLPHSFWKQPTIHEIRRSYFNPPVGHTPDFTDLFEH